MWYQNGKEVLELYVKYIRPIKSGKKGEKYEFLLKPYIQYIFYNLFQVTIMFFNSNYVNWYE